MLQGCGGEPEEMIRKKLQVILDDDLAALTADVPEKSLADSAHYVIREYRRYTEGRYSHRAVVDFYFLDKVNVRVERKYRYHRPYGKWDRYQNVYRFVGDSVLKADSQG
jgi:hypothetical protein